MPLLQTVDRLLPRDDDTNRAIHDYVAQAIDWCNTQHWNEVKDPAATVRLLTATLTVARGEALRERLNRELTEFRKLEELTRCFFCGTTEGR